MLGIFKNGCANPNIGVSYYYYNPVYAINVSVIFNGMCSSFVYVFKYMYVAYTVYSF